MNPAASYFGRMRKLRVLTRRVDTFLRPPLGIRFPRAGRRLAGLQAAVHYPAAAPPALPFAHVEVDVEQLARLGADTVDDTLVPQPGVTTVPAAEAPLRPGTPASDHP